VSLSIGEALRDDRRESRLEQTLEASLEDEDDAVLLSISGDTERAKVELSARRSVFADALLGLQQLAHDDEERALLAGLGRDSEIYRRRADSVMELGDANLARDQYRRELLPLLHLATADCSAFREHRFHEMQAVALDAQKEADRATILFGAVSLAALLLLGLVGWRLARTVIRPLRDLTTSVEAVREGHFDRRVEAQGDDELGTLARGFNRMAEALALVDATRVAEICSANETLEATLEALPEAVLVIDADGLVTRTNARARSLFDASLGRIPIHVDEVPLPPSAVLAMREAFAGASPKNPSRSDLGRAITLSEHGVVGLYMPRIVRASGRIVLVLDEVTELASFDEMRTESLAVAAHELRTPLTTLQMTLALLEEGSTARPERERETLATARIGCDQLAATVHEFLDVMRMEAGQLVIARQRVDVRGLVREVVRSLVSRFEEHEVDLAIELDGASDLIVEGDRARVGTALSNLLTNALKYSPRGGTVRLAVEQIDDGARVVVDDQGPGVPPDMRQRVFEKYFRVEHVRAHGSDHARGSGLGLYLCRQIVEAHGGETRCETAPLGGARFIAELPKSPPRRSSVSRNPEVPRARRVTHHELNAAR